MVPTRDLGVQISMLVYQLVGGSVNAGHAPGSASNMFNYTGPRGIKVRGLLLPEEVEAARSDRSLTAAHVVVGTAQLIAAAMQVGPEHTGAGRARVGSGSRLAAHVRGARSLAPRGRGPGPGRLASLGRAGDAVGGVMRSAPRRPDRLQGPDGVPVMRHAKMVVVDEADACMQASVGGGTPAVRAVGGASTEQHDGSGRGPCPRAVAAAKPSMTCSIDRSCAAAPRLRPGQPAGWPFFQAPPSSSPSRPQPTQQYACAHPPPPNTSPDATRHKPP